MKWVGFLIILVALGYILFVSIGKNPKVQQQISTNSATNTPLPSQAPTATTERLTVIAKNLSIPWGLVFLPDGNGLFTQRTGAVMLLKPSGEVVQISKIAGVNVVGEGGLLGIALSPHFNENHFVYLYYTYGANMLNVLNKVVRMKYENQSLTDEKKLVDGIPGAQFHDGGRIKFGPDGYLYIGTGDSENPSLAQNTNSLAGKILRIDEEGKPAPDNPFGNMVFTYGHRNVQGLSWDSQGNLWATEHGRSNPTGYDEVNKIEKGKNYGWPTIQGNETRQGMVTPVLNSGPTTTWAPSGDVVYNGSLFFAGLKGSALYEVKNLNSSPTLVEHLKDELGRVRDVVIGPDNNLYILTSNTDGRGNPKPEDDKIIRVNPSKL